MQYEQEQQESELTINYEPIGTAGKVSLTISLGGEVIDADKVDVTSKAKRRAYVEALIEANSGVAHRR
jgi:predicted DNA-binding WGR domain protein